MIDEKGRCCGRKPIVYKGRYSQRGYFCDRCARHYDLDTKQQVKNWAWLFQDGVWEPTLMNSDYAQIAKGGKTA